LSLRSARSQYAHSHSYPHPLSPSESTLASSPASMHHRLNGSKAPVQTTSVASASAVSHSSAACTFAPSPAAPAPALLSPLHQQPRPPSSQTFVAAADAATIAAVPAASAAAKGSYSYRSISTHVVDVASRTRKQEFGVEGKLETAGNLATSPKLPQLGKTLSPGPPNQASRSLCILNS
jgi:hypothetical protein